MSPEQVGAALGQKARTNLEKIIERYPSAEFFKKARDAYREGTDSTPIESYILGVSYGYKNHPAHEEFIFQAGRIAELEEQIERERKAAEFVIGLHEQRIRVLEGRLEEANKPRPSVQVPSVQNKTARRKHRLR